MPCITDGRPTIRECTGPVASMLPHVCTTASDLGPMWQARSWASGFPAG